MAQFCASFCCPAVAKQAHLPHGLGCSAIYDRNPGDPIGLALQASPARVWPSMLARLAAALSPRPHLLGSSSRFIWQQSLRARAPARWAPALFHTMATLQKVGAGQTALDNRMMTCSWTDGRERHSTTPTTAACRCCCRAPAAIVYVGGLGGSEPRKYMQPQRTAGPVLCRLLFAPCPGSPT